jgi:hypothetical protein
LLVVSHTSPTDIAAYRYLKAKQAANLTLNRLIKMPPTLAPFQPALGPQPPSTKLYHHEQVTLALKEKVFSLSGDDFTIKTAQGLDICTCKGKVC